MHGVAKQFSKQKYSFQNRNIIFKTEIQFSNHKSSAKSTCFQITYTKILGVGPLDLQCYNKDDNLAVVTPIYEKLVSLSSPSREEFKYLVVVSVFQCIRSLRAFVHVLSKRRLL